MNWKAGSKLYESNLCINFAGNALLVFMYFLLVIILEHVGHRVLLNSEYNEIELKNQAFVVADRLFLRERFRGTEKDDVIDGKKTFQLL